MKYILIPIIALCLLSYPGLSQAQESEMLLPTARTEYPATSYRLSEDGLVLLDWKGGETDIDMNDDSRLRLVERISIGAFNKNEQLRSIVIGRSVVEIGDLAFGYCRNLTSVTFPDGLKKIGCQAFVSCVNLAAVKLPASLEALCANPFAYCSSLTSLDIEAGNAHFVSVDGGVYSRDRKTIFFGLPGTKGKFTIVDGVETISRNAFSGSRGITEMVIPNSVYQIGALAFFNTRIKAFDVGSENPSFASPDGVLMSKSGHLLLAYPNGSGASEYIMPQGVETIAMGAFGVNPSLVKVTFSASLTSIEDLAFYACQKITAIDSPIEVPPVVASDAFYEVNAIGVLLTVPEVAVAAYRSNEVWKKFNINNASAGQIIPSEDYVLSEDGKTLVKWKGLQTAINLQDDVILREIETIGSLAFDSNKTLTKLTTNAKLQAIQDWAFEDAKALRTVSLNASLSRIGQGAFAGCTQISSIEIEAGNAHYVARDNALLTIDGKHLLLLFNHQADVTEYIVPESVEEIGASAFSGYRSLKNIVLHNGIRSIGASAFWECIALEQITLPTSLDRIESTLFFNCQALRSITIPATVQSIGDGAFMYCKGLTSITALPTIPPVLGDPAFGNIDFDAITLYVPSNALERYRNTQGWHLFGHYQALSTDKPSYPQQQHQLTYAAGTLVVDGVDRPSQLRIYTFDGRMQIAQEVVEGATYIPLESGSYLIVIDQATYRILIP